MNCEFVVYVNHPGNYMKIHSQSCVYYVHSKQKDPKNGKGVKSLNTQRNKRFKTAIRQQTSVSTLILSIVLWC
jgi:hypothetical protein